MGEPSANGEDSPSGPRDFCERLLFVIDEMIAGSVHEMEQEEEGTAEWSFWNGSGNALLQLRSFVEEECEASRESSASQTSD